MTAAAREEVAAMARMVSRAGLAEAFGHVSTRTAEGFAITSVRPLHDHTGDDVALVDAAGAGLAGPVAALPMETPLHAAVYAARPDVSAICRGHPPHVVAWGVGTADLPLLHGLGGLAGAHVGVHDHPQLITTSAQAEAAARRLGRDFCLILRANGAFAVGADLPEAATRLYFLEERARVALEAPAPSELPPEQRRQRLRHSDAELVRAKAWFVSRFDQRERK